MKYENSVWLKIVLNTTERLEDAASIIYDTARDYHKESKIFSY